MSNGVWCSLCGYDMEYMGTEIIDGESTELYYCDFDDNWANVTPKTIEYTKIGSTYNLFFGRDYDPEA